jgi:hypothetical protein
MSGAKNKTKIKVVEDAQPTLSYLNELTMAYVGINLCTQFLEPYAAKSGSFVHAGFIVGLGLGAAYAIKNLVTKHFPDRKKVWRWSSAYRGWCLFVTATMVLMAAFLMAKGLAKLFFDMQTDVEYTPFIGTPTHDALLGYFLDATFGVVLSHFTEFLPQSLKTDVSINHDYLGFRIFIVAFKLIVHGWFIATILYLTRKLFPMFGGVKD